MKKVLYINRHESGGAGKSGEAIFRIFSDLGFEVVHYNGVFRNNFLLKLHRLFAKLKFTSDIFNYSQIPLFKHSRLASYHSVILNWFGDGVFDFKSLVDFKGKIFVVVHDIYPFTGGCHYSNFCTDYNTGCTNCPNALFKLSKTFIRYERNIKMKVFNRDNVYFIYPSNNYKTSFKELYTLAKHINIKNVIDVGSFKFDKVRKFVEGPIRIVFGASDFDDPRKGMKLLKDAIGNLQLKDYNVDFISFGKSSISLDNVFHFGTINQKEVLELLGSSDYLVFPSLEENYSYIVLESLVSGCPVIAFNVGGNSELITNGENGFLIEPSELEDFLEGIIKTGKRLWFDPKKIIDNHSYEQIKLMWRQVLDGTLPS